MKNDHLELHGNAGLYVSDGNVFSFQIGTGHQLFQQPAFVPVSSLPQNEHIFLGLNGYQVCCRGSNNALVEEVTQDIRNNRLLPRLYDKEIKMLYGHGPAAFVETIKDGKLHREYTTLPDLQDWLSSWEENGMQSLEEFCKACIKNYYYFRDFFVKWRFSRGKSLGFLPVAGLECMDNRYCRLATTRQDVATDVVYYSDFRHIAVGKWNYGSTAFKIYPRFSLQDLDNYRFAAISHHRERSVDEFYGVNETHEGAKPYIKGSNENANYINSFLKNSLAAKIHIIIPNAWVDAKRKQITLLCNENKKRQAASKELLKYNGIDIGTEYQESVLLQYMREELRKVSQYLSGADNQGKAYSSTSFMDASGHEQQWRIEPVDLKYKEYVDALIAYDKRTEEALLSSVGLDAAISAVSKDGVISKSGSDAYYNYLIYIMSLTPEDEVCAQPLNLALRVNFPEYWDQGYRIGFYREVPQRQEDIAPKDRLNQQQS